MLNDTVPRDDKDTPCPVRLVLASATGKWQILILVGLLIHGPMRFNALRRSVGDVTQRVLTENLRGLERDGYLTRSVDPGPPVAVTYALTPLGEALADRLKALVGWAMENLTRVKEARSRYDARV